jgi:tRNA dimethylallyltransferase
VESREPLLVAIVGPTGSGKTSLSLRLAEQFGGEIVSCDSVVVYRDFDIGTAKPTPADRARAPHHLMDVIGPTEFMTAGDYARLGRGVLAEIHKRGRMPIVVGGTGLYLRALLEGLFAGPQRSEELRERLRARAREKGPAYLHRILLRLDPAGASQIHPNDAPKLIRAIEVCLASSQRMSEMWKRGRDPLREFRILRIGLNPERQALYTRINQRAARMFDLGLVEETATLLSKYGAAAGPLNSTGYKQVVQFLRGEISRDAAVAAAQQAHRNYAKRQMTWFRREPEVHWLSGFGEDTHIQAQALELISREHEPHRRRGTEKNL